MCHSSLLPSDNALQCRTCAVSYPMSGGIPCFAPEDSFYASRYHNRAIRFMPRHGRPWDHIPLYLTTLHYLWFIRQFVTPPGIILDIASGAGTRYLASRGLAVGLDVSLNAVRELDPSYAYGVQASAFAMPFSDGTFDYVTAKCFFEHIPIAQKPALLQEVHRVLRPGGRLLLIFDTESANLLWRWARREPDTFQAAFIENDHHYGLTPPTQALKLLEEHGFHILHCHAANKTPLVHLSMLQWLQAYRGKSRIIDLYSRLGTRLARHRTAAMAYTFAVTLWDDLVERFLPLDAARYLAVVATRLD